MKHSLLVSSLILLLTYTQGQQPNIVIMFADDLGYGDLSCYGHPTSSTPNLDKLASEGLVFTQFYTASPVCSPSRAALLTGRLQTRSGIWPGVFATDSKGGLPHNETTIAEMLKPVGYKTGMIGKWHLGVGENGTFIPINHGFDYYFGIPYSHNMCPCPVCYYPNASCINKEDCRNYNSPCPIYENAEIIQQPADLTRLALKHTAAMKGFIESSVNSKTPFFLYFAFQHTHVPQFAGEGFTNTSIRGHFGDALSELDWQVGEIMQALSESGVSNNTFVFFSADNGPSLHLEKLGGNGGLLRCGKGTTWEGGQREPAIAWWPNNVIPRRTAELAATVDLLPTIATITGADKPNVTLDGYDIYSVLFRVEPSPRDDYYYYPKDPNPSIGLFAVRNYKYKAHYYQQGSHCQNTYPDIVCRDDYRRRALDPPELYNLMEDPSELYPIDSNSDEYKTAMDELNRMKKQFEEGMVWSESQIKLGTSSALNPCANPGCTPFPACCKTPSSDEWRNDLWHHTSSARV